MRDPAVHATLCLSPSCPTEDDAKLWPSPGAACGALASRGDYSGAIVRRRGGAAAGPQSEQRETPHLALPNGARSQERRLSTTTTFLPRGSQTQPAHRPTMRAATRLLLAAMLLWAAVVAEEGPGSAVAGLPPLWPLVPELWREGPASTPQVELDPWSYLHRMAMYKALLARTAPHTEALRPNNTGNPLWGLAMQHGWQMASGRLEDPLNATVSCSRTGAPGPCISPRSWWGSMNYYLSVLPYLAAADAGLFGEGRAARPRVAQASEWPEEYCTSAASCSLAAPAAMAAWKDFFEYVNSSDKSERTNAEEILRYLWSAHQASLEAALPRFSSRLAFLPGPEATFGQDWAAMVAFVAALQFPTNQEATRRFQTLLPPRVLRVGDSPPDVADLSPQANRALQAFSRLRWANDLVGGLLDKVFRDVVCRKEDRQVVLDAVEKLLADDEVHALPDLVLSVASSAVFSALRGHRAPCSPARPRP
ncbi:protein LEG1 homolog [Lethenteron reissneri]|uniref:protein LEG1 homolog n=1 Tax=Lethenteron reissneri TaxID=7753 RepID=UPI002AB5E62C|nr:protein LEG1 homolog [Lethenteron reissneri]